MNSIVVMWLLLAGPLWGAIGAYFLPLEGKKKNEDIDQVSMRLAGLIAGFALGPLGLGYLYFQETAPRRIILWGLGLIAIFIASQAIVRIEDPNIPMMAWLLFAGPVWAVIGGYFIPQRYRNLGLDDT